MKIIVLFVIVLIFHPTVHAVQDSLFSGLQTEINKEIARKFYHDLWFNNNTEKYGDYVADEYVVHDIFDRKNKVEPAIEQKYIADFFWRNGELRGEIDYQIAEGDLVATRWHSSLEPKTLIGRFLQMDNLAIINVFRIEDGKIVEIWNHRHDIETKQTLIYVLKGLVGGLIIALIPTIIAFRLRRKLRAMDTL